ncbi:Chaperone protein DnaJ [Streptomyces rimosus subsp. rimosus]
MNTKDFVEKDYYKVLGVPKDATEAEIKKAYRKLAREFHPDANKGDAKAEERFKEISEANDILGDPKRRKEYDEARALFGNGGFRAGPGGAGGGSFNFDLGDLFGGGAQGGSAGGGFGGGLGDVFGGLFNRGGGTRTQPRRGQDVESEVTLSFTEAADGATVPLRMSSQAPCKACSGTGDKNGTPRVCPTCVGTGQVSRGGGGGFSLTDPCVDCKGRGLIAETPCDVCKGSGRATSSRTMQVRIPAGVSDGQRIRLRGKGAPGERGGPNGDLYVVVHVDAHPVFGRKGDDLTVTVPVTFPEAALGGEVRVPDARRPAGDARTAGRTPNGRTMRVRGKGASREDGTRGDLLVTVEVSVPRTSATRRGSRWRPTVRRPRARTRGRSCSRPAKGAWSDGWPGRASEPVELTEESPVYVVSVAAQLSGLHPQTLRQYDRLGLVSPDRTAGRGRRYSARDIELLREVQRLSQDEGVDLAGIKRVVELENQVAALRQRVAELQHAVEGAAAAMQQREAAVHASYRRDLVPYQDVQQTGALVVWRPKKRSAD